MGFYFFNLTIRGFKITGFILQAIKVEKINV